MRNILKRKTTAGVLAVFTKAIADLEAVSANALARRTKHEDKAEALYVQIDAESAAAALAVAEAEEADAVRRKLEELIHG